MQTLPPRVLQWLHWVLSEGFPFVPLTWHPCSHGLTVLYGTFSSASPSVLPHFQRFAFQCRARPPRCVCHRRRKKRQSITCLQSMSDPKRSPGKTFLPFDVEACQKLLDVRSLSLIHI